MPLAGYVIGAELIAYAAFLRFSMSIFLIHTDNYLSVYKWLCA